MKSKLALALLPVALFGCKFDNQAEPPPVASLSPAAVPADRFALVASSSREWPGVWKIDRQTGAVWQCYPINSQPVCVKASDTGP